MLLRNKTETLERDKIKQTQQIEALRQVNINKIRNIKRVIHNLLLRTYNRLQRE